MEQGETQLCKACHQPGSGKYCGYCGQSLAVKRISVHSIMHEVVHFFTHLEKGVGYTLKQLIKRPGHMQHEYIIGNRINHQKPFSLFFLIATLTGLILYWTNVFVQKIYGAGDMEEGAFFHQYMIFLLIFAVFYATLLNWLVFYKSGYNFAENGVLALYTLSIVFLIVVVCNLTKFVFPHFKTRYLELPLILIYTAATNMNFYKHEKQVVLLVKSIFLTILFFGTIAFMQDWFVERYFVDKN